MKPKISENVKELILYRLDASIPDHFSLSVGNKGTFTKEELREHILKEDEIGLLFIKINLDFMKAVSSGKITKVIENVSTHEHA